MCVADSIFEPVFNQQTQNHKERQKKCSDGRAEENDGYRNLLRLMRKLLFVRSIQDTPTIHALDGAEVFLQDFSINVLDLPENRQLKIEFQIESSYFSEFSLPGGL